MKDIKLQMQKSIEDTLYYDKENAIDSILKIVFESILCCERKEFLAESDEPNKANGYYTRLARGINKYFELDIFSISSLIAILSNELNNFFSLFLKALYIFVSSSIFLIYSFLSLSILSLF